MFVIYNNTQQELANLGHVYDDMRQAYKALEDIQKRLPDYHYDIITIHKAREIILHNIDFHNICLSSLDKYESETKVCDLCECFDCKC